MTNAYRSAYFDHILKQQQAATARQVEQLSLIHILHPEPQLVIHDPLVQRRLAGLVSL